MPKKDLRQMKRSRMSKDDIRKAAKNANVKANVDNINNNDIQSMEDTISQYENKSEDELMTDLEKMIRQGRKDGSFSDEMLDGFIKNVSPMMDKSQMKKLRSIAEMIKMNKF